jgi:zinc transporter ZupT
MTNGADDWKFPLLLSSLAGASTSVGAAIIFLFDSKQIQQSLPFSLTLAASVMITVSLVSIFPDCLKGVIELHGNQIVMMDVDRFLERLLSFGFGCFSYWGLSTLLQIFLLEPESILFWEEW